MFTRSSAPAPVTSEPPSTSHGSNEHPSEVLFTRPFVLMLCIQFCFGTSYSTFFLLPKYLSRQFQASSGAIGAITAIALLAGVAATPFIGRVIDRGARGQAIAYGALVHGVAAFAFIGVHGIGLPLYLLRAVQGVAYALVFNASVTLAADLAPPKKLSQAIGLCGAAGMVSNAIAPWVAEGIADRQGWGLVFLCAGGTSVLAALLSFGTGEPRVRVHVLSADALPSSSALALVFEPKRFGAFIGGAAAGAGYGVRFTFTQPFALALGASRVSAFFVGYTLSALFVRLGLGGLADKFGRRRVAFGALVLYGLVACMTSELRPNLLFAVGAVLGIAHGLLYPALNALVVEGVPRERRGAIISYFSASFYGGYAISALGAGVLAKSAGYPTVFLLTGLLVWSALAFLPRAPRTSRMTRGGLGA
jgi:MFS family permease